MTLVADRLGRDHGEMRTRVLVTGLAAVLFVFAAGTVLLLQVRVHTRAVGALCGAPFDVITGRADWQTWYADDVADPRLTANPYLIRTEACPAAVNRRTALAGALGALAAAAGMVGFVTTRERRLRAQRAPLRSLGTWVAIVGVTLTIAGVIALILLLANPSAALFLYVDRWTVAIVGAILLVPAIALASGGRALMIAAETEPRNEPSGNDALS